jgi:DNA-directed RNA polymerase specialized sigma24 family protein
VVAFLRVRKAALSQDLGPSAAGDWSGFVALFRGHAAPLYGYCHDLLGDDGEAAGAATATLIAAHTLIGRLQDPDRSRAWLLALARRECLSSDPGRNEPAEAAGPDAPDAAAAQVSLAAPAATAGLDDRAGPISAGPDAAGPDAAAGESGRSTLAALSELSGRDREVISLVHRYGLSPAELPAVLGLAPGDAAALLAGATGRFSQAAAVEDLAGIPLAAMPATIWRRSSRAVFDPALRPYRESVAAHAGQLAADGFPSTAPGAPSLPRVPRPQLKAAAILTPIAVAGLAAVFYLGEAGQPAAPASHQGNVPGSARPAGTGAGQSPGAGAKDTHKRPRSRTGHAAGSLPRRSPAHGPAASTPAPALAPAPAGTTSMTPDHSSPPTLSGSPQPTSSPHSSPAPSPSPLPSALRVLKAAALNAKRWGVTGRSLRALAAQ